MLLLTDATIEEGSIEYVKNFYTPDYLKEINTSKSNRNGGLIAIDEVNMKKTRDWEEARVTIHLDSKTIDFDAVYLNSKEEFIENKDNDKEGSGQEAYDELEELNYDLAALSFDEFLSFAEKTEELISKSIYSIKAIDKNTVINFIE